ncbi:XRE family transcriptional regulator [Pedobacter kyungheensis]|uniref:XRE family transcriptional regulator n=1 Tax=Pedobacter kyungheensis TaxID=1069985 RepID=A0A0C1DRI1_9SPHI|nr:mobile mystery protein A [Pedobacter kyungheensis]KIA96625.1 XRE family transcriptional regulator [Pedobacter kyungheensis]
MEKKSLMLQQLNAKLLKFSVLSKIVIPSNGWIKAIRNTLGMSMEQLANRLSISKQAVSDIERREKEGSITLKSLRELGRVLDMELVYGFVPKDGSLEAMVEKKANELAKKIVLRTSNTMELEDQVNSKERIEKAIQERTQEIKNEMPKILWD